MIVRNYTRRAFSLIELLVVIAIITVLAGLIMAGITAVRIRQQARTTEDIVFKVQGGLDNQVKAITDQVCADRRARTQDFAYLAAYCGNDDDRAEALLMYCKLRQVFPQDYTEATNPFSMGAAFFPIHKAYVGIPNLTGLTPEQQSAALLYIALSSMGAGGNAFEMDSVNSAVMDLPVAGVKVFKDGWNNPVGFKRFWQSPELNVAPYANPKDISFDPFDVKRKLDSVWTNRSITETQLGITFNTSNKVLTAFSAGQDKNDPADDVFGYRLRKLGNKGTP